MSNVTYLEVRKTGQSSPAESPEPALTPGFDDAYFWTRADAADRATSSDATRREWAMIGIGLAALIATLAVLFVIWSIAVS